MKKDSQPINFAQLSVKELFFGLSWLLGIFLINYLESQDLVSGNIVKALMALCSIALASKSFKGLEFSIKSWKNNEPNDWNKYLGTFGNSIIALFFIVSIILLLSGGF